MSINEDASSVSPDAGDSFWELENYKRTVKRMEDGYKLCSNLMQMIQERADLESSYAKSLKSWASKWDDSIRKGPEYATMELTCKSVLQEAESIADLHLQIRDKLTVSERNIHNEVKAWRDEHYKKPLVGNCKETKELEEQFRKAQKPWAKRYIKHLKAKKDFHSSFKQLKTVENQWNNAQADTSQSEDQKRKLSEKLEKCQRDVESTKEKYQTALDELSSCKYKYVDDMTDIFNKSQIEEKKRLEFFKETLGKICSALNLSSNNGFEEVYRSLGHSIESSNPERDLQFWSQCHGVLMTMNWPQFEEYTPDMHSISRRSKKGLVSGSDGITITSIKPANNMDIQASMAITETPQKKNNVQQKNSANNDDNKTIQTTDNNEWSSQNGGNNDKNNGVKVRAVFDYQASENDELSFKCNDVFIKLQDADDQGWCKGLKDGVEGLYPSGYANEI